MKKCKLQRTAGAVVALVFILGATATPCFAQTGERKLNTDERMIHRPAIEVGYKVIW